MIRKFFLILCSGLMIGSPLHLQADENGNVLMRIKIVGGDKTVAATLNNSRAARDFAAMLPLTLTLSDYGQNEKVSDLPRKLSTSGDPSGYTPQTGDIAYYAPWGNLAIFRRDFGYSKGLVKLGQVDNGMSVLDVSGPIQVTIEAVSK